MQWSGISEEVMDDFGGLINNSPEVRAKRAELLRQNQQAHREKQRKLAEEIMNEREKKALEKNIKEQEQRQPTIPNIERAIRGTSSPEELKAAID